MVIFVNTKKIANQNFFQNSCLKFYAHHVSLHAIRKKALDNLQKIWFELRQNFTGHYLKIFIFYFFCENSDSVPTVVTGFRPAAISRSNTRQNDL